MKKLRISIFFEYRAVSINPLLHRNKNFRNYTIKIPFLSKDQEFSYASFAHVFRPIRPLEKILEAKNDFFSVFKKPTFSVCRILNGKTSKNDQFLTHFPNIDFILGKWIFFKIDFLAFVSSIQIYVFQWRCCLSVIWWFSNFYFPLFSQY